MANDGPVLYEQVQGSTETTVDDALQLNEADLSRGYGSFTCTPLRSILPCGKEWDGALSAQSGKYPDDILDSVGWTTLTDKTPHLPSAMAARQIYSDSSHRYPRASVFSPQMRNWYDPWELPSLSPSSKFLHSSVDTSAVRQWFFFTSCDPKYSHGCRANRSTRSGYWKATGRDRLVLRDFPTSTSISTVPSSHSRTFETGCSTQPHDQLTSCTDVSVNGHAGNEHGFKKTLVFYHGKPPGGTRTPWVMHEFYISSCASSSSSASASSAPVLSTKPTAWNKILLCRITRKMDQTTGRTEHTHERST